MRYGGRTDVRTHNKIVPPYTLVWGSLRLTPITVSVGYHLCHNYRKLGALKCGVHLICFKFQCGSRLGLTWQSEPVHEGVADLNCAWGGDLGKGYVTVDLSGGLVDSVCR